jgi:hypothetical protein
MDLDTGTEIKESYYLRGEWVDDIYRYNKVLSLYEENNFMRLL